MEIMAEFEKSEDTYVQVRRRDDGEIDVVEVTGEQELVVQPNLDEAGVIRYFSHVLHNVYFQYNKVLKTNKVN